LGGQQFALIGQPVVLAEVVHRELRTELRVGELHRPSSISPAMNATSFLRDA